MNAECNGAEEALKTSSEGSDGSALKENAKMLDSIQGKLNQLKATAQETANTILNSDTVKNVLDFLTKVLGLVNKLIDEVGVLPTIVGTAMGKTLNVGRHNLPAYAMLSC